MNTEPLYQLLADLSQIRTNKVSNQARIIVLESKLEMARETAQVLETQEAQILANLTTVIPQALPQPEPAPAPDPAQAILDTFFSPTSSIYNFPQPTPVAVTTQSRQSTPAASPRPTPPPSPGLSIRRRHR